MTAAAVTRTDPSPSSSSSSGWLYGPVPDLLFGCGLLYALLFVAFAWFGPSLRALQPTFLIPVLILFVSMSHYGGTLVRVYDQRKDRRAYAIFAVWATALLAALFVWGAFSTPVASVLFTIYITWSPWHYTGQNYGLAVMFLRRGGVPLGAGGKRLLYASFVLAFLLTFLVFHSAMGVVDYNTSLSENPRIRFLPLGIPAGIHGVVFPVVAVAYLGTLIACAALLLRRGGRARDLIPAAALVLTQALWFSIPFGVRYLGIATGLEPIDLLSNQIEDYFKWVALAHAAQYLWVTSYYARGSGNWQGFPRYFGKVLASGVAIWSLPVLFFAPLVRGHYEYAGGLALLVASVVNLHHFVLDGAIWKLRSSRIASVLIRPEPKADAEPEAASPTGRGWLRPLAWTTAGAGLAVGLSVLWLEEVAFSNAFLRRDYPAMNRALDRMGWFGRDNSAGRLLAARNSGAAGDWATAFDALQGALALSPDDAEIHTHLASVARRLDAADAARRLRDALRLAPDAAGLRNQLAWMLATSGDPRIRQPEEAIGLAESLVRDAEKSDANSLDTLAAAYAAAGRFDEAIRTATQAESLAMEQGEREVGDQIRSRLALYREHQPYLEPASSDGA